MKLDGEDVIPGYGAGKGRAVDAGSGAQRALGRRGIVAVHEVETAAVADSGPESVRFFLQHLVPAHVRDFQPGYRKPRYPPGEQRKAGRVAFLAVLEEHLQSQ